LSKVCHTGIALGPFFTVLVGSYVNGKPNYVTVGAWGAVDLIPTLFVSIKKTHYSTNGIEERGYYSINVPTADIVKKVDYCGLNSGQNVDKSQLFTYSKQYSENAPIIEECPLNYLCKVIRKEEVNGFNIYFGKIENILINDEIMDGGDLLVDKFYPLITISTNYFDGKDCIGNVFKMGVEETK